MESHVEGNQDAGSNWTDEKHVHFLNSMEASFVRAMFHNHDQLVLRLDRCLPDTSDSTLDLKPVTDKNHSTTDNRGGPRGNKMNGRSNRRSRRSRSSLPYNGGSAHDQVVPQIGDNYKDETDESDHPHPIRHVPSTSLK